MEYQNDSSLNNSSNKNSENQNTPIQLKDLAKIVNGFENYDRTEIKYNEEKTSPPPTVRKVLLSVC